MSERLTDEELAQFEADCADDAYAYACCPSCGGPDQEQCQRVAAELRRLRSDEWLERAIGEACPRAGQPDHLSCRSCARLQAALKRHRDGA